MIFFEMYLQYAFAIMALLLPAAHLKVTFLGIPIYSIEAAVLVLMLSVWIGKKTLYDDMYMDVWVVVAIALFLFGAVLSTLTHSFTLTSLGMLKTWFFFPVVMTFFLFISEARRGVKQLPKIWLGLVFFIALISLTFFFCGDVTYDGRLQTWFHSPNFMASFLAPGVLFSLYFFEQSQKFGNTRYAKFISLTVLSTILVTLFLTHSYGVWIAVTFAGIVFLFEKHFLSIGILAICCVLGAFLFLEQGTDKWHSLISLDERSSLASRMMIWRSAGAILLDAPFLGIGVGRFQEVYLEYQKYYPPYLEWAVPQPHNLFLAVWLQTGLFGIIGFILLIGRLLFLLRHTYFVTTDGEQKSQVRLYASLLLFFLVYGIIDTPYFTTGLAFSFWLLVAAILSITKSKKTNPRLLGLVFEK